MPDVVFPVFLLYEEAAQVLISWQLLQVGYVLLLCDVVHVEVEVLLLDHINVQWNCRDGRIRQLELKYFF